MQRDVTAHLELELAGPAQLALEIAVSASQPDVSETLTVTQHGRALVPLGLLDQHGTRVHRVDADEGPVTIDYSARIHGRGTPVEVQPIEELRYLRPSRYSESDALRPTALGEFSGLSGPDLLASVSSWVGTRLAYVPGSSLPTDGAQRTLLARKGVCRDYAHLVVALLRALDVPARLASVYAPGLDPMDFHAVAEAAIDGTWQVVDATTLAPRSSLVRIATGRDAADTAFLSTRGAPVALRELEVWAVADELPDDDIDELVALG
jgi:transglutaminase-like putative cysteine protease